MSFDELFDSIFSDCKIDERSEKIIRDKFAYLFDRASCSGAIYTLSMISEVMSSDMLSKEFDKWEGNEELLNEFVEFINNIIYAFIEINYELDEKIQDFYEANSEEPEGTDNGRLLN